MASKAKVTQISKQRVGRQNVNVRRCLRPPHSLDITVPQAIAKWTCFASHYLEKRLPILPCVGCWTPICSRIFVELLYQSRSFSFKDNQWNCIKYTYVIWSFTRHWTGSRWTFYRVISITFCPPLFFVSRSSIYNLHFTNFSKANYNRHCRN